MGVRSCVERRVEVSAALKKDVLPETLLSGARGRRSYASEKFRKLVKKILWTLRARAREQFRQRALNHDSDGNARRSDSSSRHAASRCKLWHARDLSTGSGQVGPANTFS